MNEVGYILFGWVLGLFSPLIIDAWKAKRRQRKFCDAVAAELIDIQMRLLITGFLLGLKFGTLDHEYLVWLQAALKKYSDDEEINEIMKLVNSLVEKGVDNRLREKMRQETGVGLSIKTYSTSYMDSNLSEISGMSAELQLKIHEFRNCLNVLNQESLLASERQKMTWDSSISGANYGRLVEDVEKRFATLQEMSTRVSRKIEAVMALIH